jgi:hypothetical protein
MFLFPRGKQKEKKYSRYAKSRNFHAPAKDSVKALTGLGNIGS